jgi:hypothetical protein
LAVLCGVILPSKVSANLAERAFNGSGFCAFRAVA